MGADVSILWSRTCGKRVVRESADGAAIARPPRDNAAGQGPAVTESPSFAASWGSEPAVRVLWLASRLRNSEGSQGLPKQQLNALDVTGVWPPEGTAARLGAASTAECGGKTRSHCQYRETRSS